MKSEHSTITWEDWTLIRRLATEGVPKAQIAQRLGISRTTVIKAVNSGAPSRYEHSPASTSFMVFEPRVRELLELRPDMPATVLAEQVGWTGSIRWFRENVARLRPVHRPVDPADRIVWRRVMRLSVFVVSVVEDSVGDGSAKLLAVLVITTAYSMP